MRASLENVPRPTPRKCVAPDGLRGETVRKFLAQDEIAIVVALTVKHSGLTPQQFAGMLGFNDQSALSRWTQAQENGSALSRIYSCKPFRPPLLIAMAEANGDADVEIKTVVTIARRIA